jgi:hypothetical protein
MTQSQSVDAYITGFPAAVQAELQQVSATIHRVAPDATESMA